MRFLVSVSDISLLVYKNAIDFRILTLYLAVLPNSFVWSRSFFGGDYRVSMNTIVSSVNNDRFTFSFLSCMPLISFSCMIIMARTSSTILSKWQKWKSCLVPDLSGKAFSCCLLSIMLAVGLSYVAF